MVLNLQYVDLYLQISIVYLEFFQILGKMAVCFLENCLDYFVSHFQSKN